MEEYKPATHTEPVTQIDVKSYNRVMVTSVLPTVDICGHKIDPDNGPKNNCIHCWLTFHNNSAERVQIWSNVLANGGEAGLIAEFGEKKVKWFKKFLVAVNELRRQNEG